MVLLLTVLFVGLPQRAGAAAASPSCSLRNDTAIAVFTDVSGGVGNGSSAWEHNFWSWWQRKDPRVTWQSLTKEELVGGCNLTAFPALQLYVHAGGDAYAQQEALGTAGRDNIAGFLDEGGRYMGTCAGWYYASMGYYWEGQLDDYPFEPALLGAFPRIVEGPLVDIQDEDKYPCYKVTNVHDTGAIETTAPTNTSRTITITGDSSSSHSSSSSSSSSDNNNDGSDRPMRVVYYGGPTVGWRKTGRDLPFGSEVLATFADISGGACPAAVRVGRKLLLFSTHFEAYEGTFEKFEGKPVTIAGLPQQEIDRNYEFRAAHISKFLEANWATSTTAPKAQAPLLA